MKHTIALVVLAQLFSSCFGPKLVKESVEGELTGEDGKLSERDPANDDSFYDEYEFEADEGMIISVALSSEAFDSYLHLLGPSGRRLEDHDDIEERENTNSKIRCVAPVRGTYTVIANSYEAGETGKYKLDYETSKASEKDSDVPPCGGAEGAAAEAEQVESPESAAPSGIQVVE